MAAELWTIGLIRLAGLAPVTISVLDSHGVNYNKRNILMRGAGQNDATFMATDLISPVIPIVTADLKTVLDVTGIGPIAIGTGLTYTSVEVYFCQFAHGGTLTAGSTHLKATINKGVLIPRSVQASQGGGPATMNLDLVAVYDDTNAPIIYAASSALPSVAAASVGWVLGPIDINGTDLTGVQSVTVNFGNREEIRSGSGDYYPTFCCIVDRAPTIDLTTDMVSELAATQLALAISASDVTVFLRKLTENSDRVANATAEHISFTMDDGQIEPGDTTYSQGGPVVQAFRVIPTYDGTNAVIVLSTTTAIS